MKTKNTTGIRIEVLVQSMEQLKQDMAAYYQGEAKAAKASADEAKQRLFAELEQRLFAEGDRLCEDRSA